MTIKKTPVAAGAKVKYAPKLYKKQKSKARELLRDLGVALLLTIAFYTLMAWYCLC